VLELGTLISSKIGARQAENSRQAIGVGSSSSVSSHVVNKKIQSALREE
jgi:hypothetical protein